MSRATAWFVHVSFGLVGIGGLVYAYFVYFVADPVAAAADLDPAALVDDVPPSTWQPLLQTLHVLAAALFVFAVGLLWRGHIWSRLRNGSDRKRASGMVLTWLFLIVAVTGYAFQISVDEEWRTLWSYAHASSGALLVVVYVWHQVYRRGEVADASSPFFAQVPESPQRR